MTHPTPQSRCCQAPVRTDGGPDSWFWRCTRCAQPCDAELAAASMTPTDWENVARCAWKRCRRAFDDLDDISDLWLREWMSCQAAQALSGRSPF